jgi:hypothetical protein
LLKGCHWWGDLINYFSLPVILAPFTELLFRGGVGQGQLGRGNRERTGRHPTERFESLDAVATWARGSKEHDPGLQDDFGGNNSSFMGAIKNMTTWSCAYALD